MKILFFIHLYPPRHNAGGEMMCHNIAKFFQDEGHDVLVLLTQASHYDITTMYAYDGITVIPAMKDISMSIKNADFIFTHLAEVNMAISLGRLRAYRKPVCFISHNTHDYDIVRSFPDQVSVIYKSHAMANTLKYDNRSIVVHPPVDYRKWDFKQDPSKSVYITLVNMNANKGVKLFMAIVKAMPDRLFLGVGGAYDGQIGIDLPNFTYMPNSPDMESVYIKTRILLCPSKYESWGMCASEAMCSGIPIIYNETFGLLENVGDAGIGLKDKNPTYEDEELKGGESPDGLDPEANLAQWIKAIKKLDNPETYKKYSESSRKRSRELDPVKELKALEAFALNEIETVQIEYEEQQIS